MPLTKTLKAVNQAHRLKSVLVLAPEQKFAVADLHHSKLGVVKRNSNQSILLHSGWAVGFRDRPDVNDLRFFRSVMRKMGILERVPDPQQFAITRDCRHMPTVTFYVK